MSVTRAAYNSPVIDLRPVAPPVYVEPQVRPPAQTVISSAGPAVFGPSNPYNPTGRIREWWRISTPNRDDVVKNLRSVLRSRTPSDSSIGAASMTPRSPAQPLSRSQSTEVSPCTSQTYFQGVAPSFPTRSRQENAPPVPALYFYDGVAHAPPATPMREFRRTPAVSHSATIQEVHEDMDGYDDADAAVLAEEGLHLQASVSAERRKQQPLDSASPTTKRGSQRLSFAEQAPAKPRDFHHSEDMAPHTRHPAHGLPRVYTMSGASKLQRDQVLNVGLPGLRRSATLVG